MKVYDITVPLGPDTPIWDDGPAPRLKTLLSLARGDFATVTAISMGSHSGTHTDAPAHFARGGVTIDAIPAETLVGAVQVVEHAGTAHITADDLAELGVDGRCPRVLFKTANRDLWDRPGFQTDFVALAPSAAERLIELGVVLVGIDYLSIEPYEEVECGVHHRLLEAGIVVLEGADTRAVPPGQYLLACAPLKMVGAEGAPTRAFLVEGV
jgi:arylformamidase